jgi:hypothetical protein
VGIGIGIFLLALGLILALVVGDDFGSYDVTMAGWILTGVGVLGIVLALVMNRQRPGSTTTVVERDRPPDGGRGA